MSLPERPPTAILGSPARPPAAADPDTIATVTRILAEVQQEGEPALRRHAERLDGLPPGAPLRLDRDDLARAAASVPPAVRALLERTRDRIQAFAQAQRAAFGACTVAVPGGRGGHGLAPVATAGCYAPGGRFPLPSSLLMTAVTARTAGVPMVLAASPRPAPVTLAAAHLAGVDALLPLGGAQAIGALAYGVGVPACDVLCGPGNRFVAEAKRQVAGRCGIDLPAGPSELVVVADESAPAESIAADLLAQAEHDPDARPFLLAIGRHVLRAVQAALRGQLPELATAAVARQALANGAAVCCADLGEAVALADHLAPEHLQLCLRDAEAAADRFAHYGALFVGHHSGEVLGDYGIGPNHVLPTAGAARFTGGLSVLHFLRVRTWLLAEPGPDLDAVLADAEALARLEGLHGHARAARLRRRG